MATDGSASGTAALDPRFDGLPRRELDGGRILIEAKTHRSRNRGLSRLDRLDSLHALHIPATPSIHTIGMRFSLDLLWLDRSGALVRLDRDVGPWRMRFCRRARSVIETVAGEGDAFVSALGL